MAVDGSVYTQHMLEYVLSRQPWLLQEGDTTFLTVVPELPPRAAAYMNAVDIEAYCDAQAATVLDPIRQFAAAHDWQPDCIYRIGKPGEVIAEFATAGGFDLVIMGTRGHTPITSLVLGSVTAQVLARSTVPVLIVPRNQP